MNCNTLHDFRELLGDSFLSQQIIVGHCESEDWTAAIDFQNANKGPFNDLLVNIGKRAKTDDKKIIAAAFAARLGWASVGAIAPLLLIGNLPILNEKGFALRFNTQTLFTGIHFYKDHWCNEASITDTYFDHLSLVPLEKVEILFPTLMDGLHQQLLPIMEALYSWSRFSRRGAWGQIYASWGSVFKMVADQAEQDILPYIRHFFSKPMMYPTMAPDFYTLAVPYNTKVFHRRASCCLYYRLPQGGLCTSCPLETDEKRLLANMASLNT